MKVVIYMRHHSKVSYSIVLVTALVMLRLIAPAYAGPVSQFQGSLFARAGAAGSIQSDEVTPSQSGTGVFASSHQELSAGASSTSLYEFTSGPSSASFVMNFSHVDVQPTGSWFAGSDGTVNIIVSTPMHYSIRGAYGALGNTTMRESVALYSVDSGGLQSEIFYQDEVSESAANLILGTAPGTHGTFGEMRGAISGVLLPGAYRLTYVSAIGKDVVVTSPPTFPRSLLQPWKLKETLADEAPTGNGYAQLDLSPFAVPLPLAFSGGGTLLGMMACRQFVRRIRARVAT